MDRLLTTAEAAEFLNVSESWLNHARLEQPPQGPPFVRVTKSRIRYPEEGLRRYIQKALLDPAWFAKEDLERFRNKTLADPNWFSKKTA